MKIILAAGGSGGHIFPSIALASELEKRGVGDIYFISSKRRLDRNVLENYKEKSFFLSVNPMPFSFNPIKIIIFMIKLLSDTIASFFILGKIRPDAVVGFGGYSSGCIVKCAALLGIPVLIHEQNLYPGRANRILGKSAERIAVSFKESKEHFPGLEEKVVYTGNPLRLELLSNNKEESASKLELSLQKPTVLVMGGSQGSTFLNKTVSEAANLVKKEVGEEVQFIHLTGTKDYEYIKDFYRENNIPARVFSFLERIDDAYAASDIAISRAGAAALFELALYSKPMILAPYPNPKNNQRYNAIYFSEKGAAVYKEESDLSPPGLAEVVVEVLKNNEKREKMSKAAAGLANPYAGRDLADEVLKLAEKRK
jgi:UDP-N-acetylglucosamine--N-acetylmuramyl-(pentapeptide) pyrophosphoryl-undecaprenol N-acetylglucosamine transferase